MLPWTAPIIICCKPGNSEQAGLEGGGQGGVECFGDGGFDLVLDGDVKAGTSLVLGDQQAAKVVREFVAEAEQFGAVDAVRDAPAEHHDVAEPRYWWRTLRCQQGQSRFDFGQVAGGQMVEQSDVRVEMVALGWEMRAAQSVSPGLVGLAHFGGDDDRGRHWIGLAMATSPYHHALCHPQLDWGSMV